MTTWNEVVTRAQRTARTLQQAERKPVRYENTHGVDVKGWQLMVLGTTSDDIVYRGTDYDECLSHHKLILGTNGTIYESTLLHIEEGRRETGGFRVTTVKKPSVHQLHPQSLHPVTRQRHDFEELLAALNRLAQAGNATTEQEAPKSERSETFSEYEKSPVKSPAVAPPPPSRSGPATLYQPEPEPKRGDLSLPLMVLPFVFLAVLVVILVLVGARPN